MYKEHSHILLYAKARLLHRNGRRGLTESGNLRFQADHPLIRHDKTDPLDIPYCTF